MQAERALRRVFKAFPCGAGIFSAQQVFANEGAFGGLQDEQSQARTMRALQMIEQNIWEPARGEIAATKDPLAAKLYFWLYYTRQDKGINFVRLSHFIRDNPEWPGIYGLRLKAEKLVDETLPARDIVAWFDDYKPVTAAGTDKYLQAILKPAMSTKHALISRIGGQPRRCREMISAGCFANITVI